MSGRSARPYDELEREFTTQDISMSQFAISKGIPKSAMARKAAMKDAHGLTWYDKQAAYLASIRDKANAIVADAEAIQQARRQTRILTVGDTVFDLFERQKPAIEAQIAEGKMPISVRDLVVVAQLMREVMGGSAKDTGKPGGPDFLQLIRGDVSQGTLPAGTVSQLESALRSVSANGRAAAGTPEPDSQRASPD